jgi:hypothetical protein
VCVPEHELEFNSRTVYYVARALQWAEKVFREAPIEPVPPP